MKKNKSLLVILFLIVIFIVYRMKKNPKPNNIPAGDIVSPDGDSVYLALENGQYFHDGNVDAPLTYDNRYELKKSEFDPTQDYQITTNFKKSEFDCHNGDLMDWDIFKNICEVAFNLEYVRLLLGSKPLHINSGYRSKRYNDNLVAGGSGAVKGSYHIKGMAADFTHPNKKPAEIYTILDKYMNKNSNYLSQGGLGKYSTFNHYDIRGTKARWGA
jgi:hypothetical protein